MANFLGGIQDLLGQFVSFHDFFKIFIPTEDGSVLGGAVPPVNGYVSIGSSLTSCHIPSYGGCYHSHTNYPLVN